MNDIFSCQSPPISTKTTISFKELPEKAGIDSVLAGRTVWDSLHLDGIQCYLALQPAGTFSFRYLYPRAIICFAALDEEVDGVAIPPRWSVDHGEMFPRSITERNPPFLAIPSDPVSLKEVVVIALSQQAYTVACSSSLLENRFFSENQILRQGDIHTISSENFHTNGSTEYYRYQLKMVGPVLQGIAQKEKTEIILILSLPNNFNSDSPSVEAEKKVEGFEIGEAFLADSAVSLLVSPETRYLGTNKYSSNEEIFFETQKISHPVDILNDGFTLYIRTTDLSHIGILSGDWGIAQVISTSGVTNSRLVRVVADDDLVDVRGILKASPILLHNIGSSSSEPRRRNPAVSLHSTHFGSGTPAIPIAQTLTLARVASPVSTNRKYEPLFIGALKSYFNLGRALLKKGDLIAVALNSTNLCFIRTSNDSEVSKDDQADYSHPFFSSFKNTVVFFLVTNIEHDILKTDNDPDLYVTSTSGELGCWVDPAVTCVVQSGVEHYWIPDIGIYLEEVSPRVLYSALVKMPYSNLLGPDSSYAKLLKISSAVLLPDAIHYNLCLSILLEGARGTGKFTTAFWVAQKLGMHLLEVNCYDVIGENDVKTEGTIRSRFDKARESSPCVCVLRHLEAFYQTTQIDESKKDLGVGKAIQECIKETTESWKVTGYPVVIMGTTSRPGSLLPSILSTFQHRVTFESPGEVDRREILACSAAGMRLAPDVSLHNLAVHTAAFVAADLVDLVARAIDASVERVICASGNLTPHHVQAGIALTAADFESARGKARALFSDNLGAPKIPNVSWDDVGGLKEVKSEILDTVQLPLEHPELFANGLKKRSGILLYGPPGTGKTMLAKAVATSCSLNFFSVKGPELLNMYIGESEANVRRVFQRARDAKPCVIFFDELDSLAPKRGIQGDSGGVMDRIVSQLLAELDGLSSGEWGTDVFVIGATNRPDLLDPALLRPGRFDRLLYLGINTSHEAQTHVLEALTRKFRVDPNLYLEQVAEKCPFNLTGADFYALCSDAMHLAMSRKASQVDQKIALLNQVPLSGHPYSLTPQYYLSEMATPEEIEVIVCKEDFDRALETLVPSVSPSEVEYYARIQRGFSEA